MLVPFPDHGEIPLFPDRMMIQATSIYIRATFGLGSIYAAALIKKKNVHEGANTMEKSINHNEGFEEGG